MINKTIILTGIACVSLVTINNASAGGHNCIYDEATDTTICDEPTDPAPVTDPLACYHINKVKIYDRTDISRDVIKIQKASFRLPDTAVIDFSTAEVEFNIDGMLFNIASGDLIKKGDKEDYIYKSTAGASPEISARLRVDKAEWELKVKDTNVSMDTTDGLDIGLSINNIRSSENVLIDSKDGIKYKYKNYPKQSCRLDKLDEANEPLPGNNKLSCISSMTVRHISGREVTKSTVEANLLHPETVFIDETTGDYAAFHTSCSRALACGDIAGNFVISEISATPGDKLSQKMGVDDASCILP